MASYRDLLDAIARVGAATGDPDAWKDGLTGADVAVACTPTSPAGAVDAVLAKLTAAHPAVFAPAPAVDKRPSHSEGAAADAIRAAEALLARQRSDAAQLDLQVLTAVANAHATAGAGLARLAQLQSDIETAVASRTDLDTPAGARELQRFLIAKMRDIRDVVENAGLDSSSKATLAEALAALYVSSTPAAPDTPSMADAEAPSGAVHSDRNPPDPGSLVSDPPPMAVSAFDDAAPSEYLSTDIPLSDPGPLAAPAVAPPAPPAMSVPPYGGSALPTAPFGGGMPFGGGTTSGFTGPTGLSDAPWPDLSPAGLTATDPPERDPLGPDETPPARDEPDDSVSDSNEDQRASADPFTEPTPVLLPDGQTVVAPTPELAAVITAAVAGAPIPTAFSWQGITIPAPGSVVTVPVDPGRVVPGDIAVLADRHALALGDGKVLLDQQIQPMSSVTGPGFIGWQHPPQPDPMNTMPALPAPDRTAATAPS